VKRERDSRGRYISHEQAARIAQWRLDGYARLRAEARDKARRRRGIVIVGGVVTTVDEVDR